MKQSEIYQGKKISATGEEKKVEDALLLEQALQIIINSEPLSITMQTPGHELDLVRGLLYCEDIYRKKNPHPKMVIQHNKSGIIDSVSLNINKEILGTGYLNSRQLLSVASCGICGRTSFEGRAGNISKRSEIPYTKIPSLFEIMQKNQNLFTKTGGCHGAAAFDKNGNMLVVREDIGRHNAVDKVVGALLMEEKLEQANILLVSGRVSYEIVSKCFMAGIPALAAVSAPSSLAVDFSKELGIELMAFCREGKLTVYA
ncbi:MAG: formate dehydrogenase accessory sulfurtransferase FdhD [Sphingobacteriaceae bacterium]|nr:formate dehydrogenase accessory sulfurtransferase FdhD [Sphingobacteriaceae bacterium]